MTTSMSIVRSVPPRSTLRNRLLALEPVPLPLGWAAYESGAAQAPRVFSDLRDRIAALLLENGASAEIAVVGGETTPSRAVVQSAGEGYRLAAGVLKEEFDRGGALQHMLLRYTQALITQMAQTAVCNRHHSVDQQLCRWLLLSLDRPPAGCRRPE